MVRTARPWLSTARLRQRRLRQRQQRRPPSTPPGHDPPPFLGWCLGEAMPWRGLSGWVRYDPQTQQFQMLDARKEEDEGQT